MDKNNSSQIDDDSCVKILTIMALYKPTTHFNELHRELKKRNMELSKPTLSLHLGHLIKKKHVFKTEEENTQYVTYSLDPGNRQSLEHVTKRAKNIVENFKENEKEFYSLSEQDQVYSVLIVDLHRKIEEIKALIDFKLNPNDLGKVVLVNFLTSGILEIGQKLIIKKSVEDEEYRKKIFRFLEEAEDRLK